MHSMILAAAALILGVGPSKPGDGFGNWPQFRGPNRDGISTETGLLQQWPESGPPLMWKASEIGNGYSSVAIRGDRAYVLGARDADELLIALDPADGKIVWTQRIGETFRNKWGDGPRSTPTVSGEAVYALSSRGDLFCVAAATGKPKWNVNLLEKYGGRNIKWGISESPLVEGKHVICNSGGSGGSIVALDKHTGREAWRSVGLDDTCSYASAVAATIGGVRQIVHFIGGAAVGIRASDGKPMWRYEKVANDTANCANPIISGSFVFVTSGYDTGAALLKLASKGGATAADEVYFTRDMMNHHGGVVLHDGHVYGFSSKMLACLELQSGKEKWSDRSVGKGSVLLADGRLYLLSEKGAVGLCDASPEGYRERGRFSLEVRGEATFAHPVVAGGRLYLRNGDELLCYNLRP